MSLREALIRQAKACESLGSSFNGRLLRVLAAHLEPGARIADRLLTWPGDISPSAQSVPLRLAGSLHALVIDGSDPALAACYPPHTVSDAALWGAVSQALVTHADRLDHWLNSAPQTNEVARSAALIAVGQVLAARYDRPLVLSELGASAGLNLFWDRYGLVLPGAARFGPAAPVLDLTPDWSGPLPPDGQPNVAARRGVDLNPLNPRDPSDCLRLAAYLWPDQTERQARSKAAIAQATPVVDRGGAADWLKTRLQAPFPGQVHMVYHTVAWQYFPAAEQARAQALIEAAGAQATDDAPLAWFGMEADGGTPGAGMVLRLWPGNVRLDLGRVDFHGRWVRWAGAESG